MGWGGEGQGRDLTGRPHSPPFHWETMKTQSLEDFSLELVNFFPVKNPLIFYLGDISLIIPFWESGKVRSLAEGLTLNMWIYI